MKKNQWMVRSFLDAQKHRALVWGFSAALASLAGTLQAATPALAEDITLSQSVEQTKTVTGTVVDETGEPLIGVSVLVQGTTTGAITDFDGKFSLQASGDATLVVSYIGYKTQQIKVGNKASFSIVLKTDNQLLEEVVVVGYGTVKKRDLTGAVASVKSEDITLTPSSNPMQALQGRGGR